ncbi:MAG: DUF2207 domain-containing protein, partial [Firmicutes bacterium]|nr:DUF2207 domain-containing protein [Bacillota bacterium]
MTDRRDAINYQRGSSFPFALFLGLVLIFLLCFVTPAYADARSYYFPRVMIEAELRPDGSMGVVEERTFNFNGRYRGAWEYIYLKDHASVKDVLVSEEGVAYEQMPPGTQDIPGIFYVEEHPGHIYIDWSFEAIDEERTFTISYIVENAVQIYEDGAELYYQFIGDEWEERTEYAQVVLTLPEG